MNRTPRISLQEGATRLSRFLREEGAFLGRPDQAIDHLTARRRCLRSASGARFAFLAIFCSRSRSRASRPDRRRSSSRPRFPTSPVAAPALAPALVPRRSKRFRVGHRRKPEEGARRGRGVGAVLARLPRRGRHRRSSRRCSRSGCLGRDDGHAVARPAKRFLERSDSDRAVAVVVGEENAEAAAPRARHGRTRGSGREARRRGGSVEASGLLGREGARSGGGPRVRTPQDVRVVQPRLRERRRLEIPVEVHDRAFEAWPKVKTWLASLLIVRWMPSASARSSGVPVWVTNEARRASRLRIGRGVSVRARASRRCSGFGPGAARARPERIAGQDHHERVREEVVDVGDPAVDPTLGGQYVLQLLDPLCWEGHAAVPTAVLHDVHVVVAVRVERVRVAEGASIDAPSARPSSLRLPRCRERRSGHGPDRSGPGGPRPGPVCIRGGSWVTKTIRAFVGLYGHEERVALSRSGKPLSW